MAAIGDSAAPRAKGLSLHVGINEVGQSHYAEAVRALKNCINDAKAMQDLAQFQGFEESKILIDAAATRDAVKDAVASAAGRLKAGDIFLFTYSGHGSQVVDQNEDELENVRPGRELDKHDETWCLYDGMMVDDEVNQLWQSFAPDVRVLALLDCCHAETSIRDIGGRPRRAAPGLPRRLPLMAAAKVQRNNRAFYADIQAKTQASVRLPIACSVEVLAACEDDQEASDGEEGGNGFFTGQLLDAWDNGNFNGSLTDFYELIKEYMSVAADQTPKPFRDGELNPAFLAQRPFTI